MKFPSIARFTIDRLFRCLNVSGKHMKIDA